MKRRVRDLGVSIGSLPTGAYNAITDVPGVWVGHQTVIRDSPSIARTGVTMVVPRQDEIWHDYAYAGYHSFSGDGEMTGTHWIQESGLLGSAIGITNTHQTGMVRDALVRYSVDRHDETGFILPVVAETYDGHLNDAAAFPLTEEDVLEACLKARSGPVEEGNVGGGTGMLCHEFKGGIGTSSRVVDVAGSTATLGVLVQANYGIRADLRIDGVPVGAEIGFDEVPSAWDRAAGEDGHSPDGSIIVVIATDAPILADQCARLAKRATVGLARVGGYGHDSSGDIFLAFATGNHLPKGQAVHEVRSLDHSLMTPLFRAAADAVEESILNALCAAETMTGQKQRVAHEMPLDRVEELLARRPL